MEAVSRRHKREFDLTVSGAWHAEAFARTKKLKKLSEYVGDKPKSVKATTPDEMFAVLQMMKAGGAPLNIRTIN